MKKDVLAKWLLAGIAMAFAYACQQKPNSPSSSCGCTTESKCKDEDEGKCSSCEEVSIDQEPSLEVVEEIVALEVEPAVNEEVAAEIALESAAPAAEELTKVDEVASAECVMVAPAEVVASQEAESPEVATHNSVPAEAPKAE